MDRDTVISDKSTADLVAKLKAIIGTEDHELLSELVRELLQSVLPVSDPDKEKASSPRVATELARLAEGNISRLASIQHALVDHFSPTDDQGATPTEDTVFIGSFLAQLSQAFADYETPDTISLPLSQPEESEDVGYDFLQQIIDAVADPIFVKDKDHRWIFLNEAYCNFMGYPREELIGMSDFDFFPEEEAQVFWRKDDQVFSTGEPDENEERFTDAKGKEHIIVTKKTMFVDSRQRSYLVGVIRDITERRRLESRLDVARRLMSLGTLAGGIAHEINNPLSFVLANLDHLRTTLGDIDYDDSEISEILEATIRGANRVRDIVSGLKTFSDSDGNRLEPLDLRPSLQASVQVASNEIRHRAQLVERYGEVPIIDGNERILGQVFLNLLINAAQSLQTGDADQNEIRVETSTNAGGMAVVEISDTGCGIPDRNLNQIFDPFFSTKTVGEGTGLGLSICHSLVEAMNGYIEVDSQPGVGSTFRVLFPPSSDEIAPSSPESPSDSSSDSSSDDSASSSSSTKPNLLLIDDESELLSSMKRRLQPAFNIRCARSGQSGLELLGGQGEFDLIVCDVMMPQMNGREFYDALSRQAPHLLDRLVFASAGVFDPQLNTFFDTHDLPVLDKLLDISELLDLIES